MNEFKTLVGALAVQSFRYNTFRGKWTDMPEATGLCLILSILSFLICTLAIYIEYNIEMALAIPVVWLSAVWLFAAEEGSWQINKRLLSALSLLAIPMGVIQVMLGSGHEFLEVAMGMYLSAAILTLKARE